MESEIYSLKNQITAQEMYDMGIKALAKAEGRK